MYCIRLRRVESFSPIYTPLHADRLDTASAVKIKKISRGKSPNRGKRLRGRKKEKKDEEEAAGDKAVSHATLVTLAQSLLFFSLFFLWISSEQRSKQASLLRQEKRKNIVR